MNEPISPADWGESGVTIVRVFEAPRERVWAEWTQAECFADWYGGVEAEVPVNSVSMDVREGGAWRATMFAGPDRLEIHWNGEYLDVAAPRLLVLTITDQPVRRGARSGHRPAHRPRRQSHRDALPPTWRDDARAVRPGGQRLGRVLPANGGAARRRVSSGGRHSPPFTI